MDALGPRAEEGRGKTAISPGEPSSGLSRGFPNGETHPGSYRDTRLWREVSGRTETSNYPEEKKSTEIPLVVANERGRAQTWQAEWTEVLCLLGVVTLVSSRLSGEQEVKNPIPS